MNNTINSIRHQTPVHDYKNPSAPKKKNFAAKLADGALDSIATVGSVIPGGQIVAAAAKGLKALKGDSAVGDQMEQMWEMQRENQVFNLQYLQLQQAMQEDNRRYSTFSNLLKARHDTAKAAINNMQV